MASTCAERSAGPPARTRHTRRTRRAGRTAPTRRAGHVGDPKATARPAARGEPMGLRAPGRVTVVPAMAAPSDATGSDVQATFAATLVDEWVRAGVTDAVVCPGSRSTPLALAIDSHPDLRLHVRLDERGAGFFALGLALSTGRPPVVCVTSGTAAAELHPAVVEAHHARVPVIVCTADRPPELHGVGAPQTIAQAALFGPAVRWAADPGVPDPAAAGTWRSLAARAAAEAGDGPLGPGPVLLNLAFRGPLVGRPGPLPAPRPAGAPWHRAEGGAGAAALPPWAHARGVLLAGAGAGPPDAVLALASHLGWPGPARPPPGRPRPGPPVVPPPPPRRRAPPAAL